MPDTYRKRIYVSLVHTDSFRQTHICVHNTLRIKINNRDVTVSIDRLKPAFIVPDDLEKQTADSGNVLSPTKTVQATTIEPRKKTLGIDTLRGLVSGRFRVIVVNCRTEDILYSFNL